MPIRPDELGVQFPRLYHMAHEDAWEGIQKHGLLSTSVLLDLFQIGGEQRRAIESQHRPQNVTVDHETHGHAVIRDQKPMSDGALKKCLKNMKVAEWYETLNRKVFFWLSAERLNRLLSARAYRNETHCVLTIATAPLLARHLARVTLSPINSGSTIFNPQPRGSATFLPLDKYPFVEWAKKRGTRNAVAELAVEYEVPDIGDFTLRVVTVRGGRTLKLLFDR